MESIILVGKTVDEASAELEKIGLTLRVTKIDGNYTIGTRDVDRNRVNVYVENGLISKVIGLG